VFSHRLKAVVRAGANLRTRTKRLLWIYFLFWTFNLVPQINNLKEVCTLNFNQTAFSLGRACFTVENLLYVKLTNNL